MSVPGGNAVYSEPDLGLIDTFLMFWLLITEVDNWGDNEKYIESSPGPYMKISIFQGYLGSILHLITHVRIAY